MARIILKYDSAAGAIQEMDSASQDYITHTLLTDFNTSDSDVGTIQVNPASTTGLTLIGSFTDTRRTDAPGTHPVGTSTTDVTFNFYQNLGSDTESITITPLMLNADTDIQRMADSDINNDFILNTQQDLVNEGIGMYKMQPTAPSGGTWVEKFTITNQLQNTSNTTKIWRKSASATTPATVRPLKYVVSNSSIREMTDAEIKQYTPRLRNRIVGNGIGQYRVQATAPTSGGTWVIAGSEFSDTRYEIANQNYTTNFSNTFTGTFSNTFVNFFTGSYSRFFNGSFGGTFSGSRSRFFTGFFSNTFTGFFTGFFTGATVQNTTETVTTVKLWVRVA